MSADAEVARSIRLPKRVWDALDKDAARCRRSSVKQLEALLVTFYDLEDVEIDRDALDALRADRHLNEVELPIVDLRKSKDTSTTATVTKISKRGSKKRGA